MKNKVVEKKDQVQETEKKVVKKSLYSKNPNFYEIDGSEKIEVISSKIEQIITL